MKINKLFLPIFIILCLIAYIAGYTSTTTTTNLSLVKPASEDTTVNFFDTVNTNMDLIDANSPKVKLDATSAPGVTNDTDEGYMAGSIWVDVTNDKAYTCLDNTDGAAVWTETTQAGGGSGTVTTSGSPVDNDFAKFTSATAIEGRSYSETKADLDLEIGTDVLAQQSIGITDNYLLEVDGLSNANEYARFTANGLVGRTEAEFKGDFNLEIGTDVEAHDDGLLSIAGLTTAANKMIYTTALDTYAVIDLTAFGRSIIDDADASAVRTTIDALQDVANAIDSDHYTDSSIDHEHLAPDVISGLAEVTSADLDMMIVADQSDGWALKKVDMGEVRGGSAGSAITFDIGDDGGNDSVDVNEIATTGDTNSIFTEPSADKILIALANNWPGADLATLATTITVTDNEATAENNPICFVAGADPDGGSLGIETDGDLHYNPSTGLLTATGFAGDLTGNVTGDASGSSGSCTGNAATCTTASAGDAAVDFFGAGVDAVTDATTCTDVEGTLLAIAGGVLNAAIPADHVTYDMMQDVTATDKVLGRSSAGAGTVEEIACTAAGRAILDDANAAAQRSTLGAAASGANTDITSILNAALYVGRDADNQIKFATDNKIVFRVNAADKAEMISSGELDMNAGSVGFTLQTATGDGTTTIDWKLGNKFKFTFGAQNDTLTFTAPTNPCTLMLTIIQDGTGSRTMTWPATVKWAGGAAPTLTTTANARDKVALDWDGAQYDGVASLDFK